MKPRNLQQLLADHETEKTISEALAELKQLKPATPQQAAQIADLRRELEAELATIQQAGRLL